MFGTRTPKLVSITSTKVNMGQLPYNTTFTAWKSNKSSFLCTYSLSIIFPSLSIFDAPEFFNSLYSSVENVEKRTLIQTRDHNY